MDASIAHLHEVTVPRQVNSPFDILPPVSEQAPEFVRSVLGEIISGNGDSLPVSALPPDGTFPTGTAKWEKRNIAQQIPVWDEQLCIQCGKCVLVCPHAVIRAKIYDTALLAGAPAAFKSAQTALARVRIAPLHAAGVPGRLHRLPPLRGSLPGQEQERSKTQGHQYGRSGAPARNGKQELGFLPVDSGVRPRPPVACAGEGRPVARAAV